MVELVVVLLEEVVSLLTAIVRVQRVGQVLLARCRTTVH